LLHYSGTNVAFSDAKQINAGIFFESQVSQYLHFRGSVGYTLYSPDTGQSTNSNQVSDFTGIYADLSLQHRLNRFLVYTLSGGRSINFAFYGGSVDLIYARWLANWKVMEKVGISTSLQYEHGTQVTFTGETFDRYGGSISLSRTLTAKSTGSLGYQFYWRTSDVKGRDYTANIVSLNFSYRF